MDVALAWYEFVFGVEGDELESVRWWWWSEIEYEQSQQTCVEIGSENTILCRDDWSQSVVDLVPNHWFLSETMVLWTSTHLQHFIGRFLISTIFVSDSLDEA